MAIRIRSGLLTTLFSLSCLFSGDVLAARTVTSATVDGGSVTTVAPGASITAVVNVSTSGSDNNWQCTTWAIAASSPGTPTAVNHSNHNSSGSYSETFAMTAPSVAGTYNVYFVAYNNDACTTGASSYTLASAVIVDARPNVLSISRSSSNPAAPNSSVTWQVVFDRSVTGVDSGDFSLLQGSGATGASITAVSGSGTTWTVTANTGTGTSGTLQLNLVDNDTIVSSADGTKLGGTGAGNGNFSGEAYTIISSSCVPPANTPSGLVLTCQCDSFGRSTLNPSPMFTTSNWVVSTSDTTGVVPYLNTSTGFLRLTEKTGNNAKAATAPGFFPAAGNYISVEFKHYAYNGSGADGIAVTLSDYTVPAVPGAFGGSLGYAQKTAGGTVPGFAGGWIGIAVDEYGNYSNPTEGRVGGVGFIADAVAVRGSGSGTSGYPYLGGSGSTLSPGVDNAASTTPAYGHYYQVIVDARNAASGKTLVAVNRDTTGTRASYASVVPSFDAFAAATLAGYTQAAVPANWQLSFTGSTGGSTNIHELGEVRICAQNYVPPDGGTAGGFSAIDDAYSSTIQNFLTGHIYTKLVGTAFKLKLAALSNSQILTTYAASGTKNVAIKLVDNSDGACGTDANRATACATSACNGKTAVTGGSQTLAYTSTDKGIKTTADFTINTAYANLVAVMNEGAVTACSVDTFAVRPTRFSSVTSSATNATLTGAPKFKAGTDSFTLTATANAAGYSGTPKVSSSGMSATAAGWTVGSLSPIIFPNATPGASTSVATGSFTYSEVGNFRFLGFDPATDTTSVRGVYDDDWVAVDSAATKNDCVAGSYSNAKDASGKYGCLFGLLDSGTSAPNSVLFGRFIPDRIAYLGGGVTSFCSSGTKPFTYMGQPQIGIAYRLQAVNGAGVVTKNYSQALGYPVVNPSLVAEDQDTANQGCDLASRIGGLAAAQWSSGLYVINDANADNAPDTSAVSFSRPASPVALSLATCAANRASAGGPFWLLDIGVTLNDTTDGVTIDSMDMNSATTGICSGAACSARKIGTTGVVDGRLWLNNAYGSEMLPLSVPVLAQYWSSAGWRTNSYDSCTALTQPTRQDTGNAGLVFYAPPDTARNGLAPGEAVAQMNGSTAASVAMVNGDGKLVLRGLASSSLGPGVGNFGYVDVIGSKLTPSASWLPATGNARACFGSCGPRSPVIYFRERY